MIAGTTILSLIELAHALQLLVKTELKGLLERSVLENINHRPVIEETANDVFLLGADCDDTRFSFVHHTFSKLKATNATTNFYKCGDKLPEPHFCYLIKY